MSKKREQKILDVMFDIVSRVQANDRVPKDRDDVMEWARRQLELCGIKVRPMGMSHAVLMNSDINDIGYMDKEALQLVKDSIADVACWHHGFNAASKDHKGPPQLDELIEFGYRLQKHINSIKD